MTYMRSKRTQMIQTSGQTEFIVEYFLGAEKATKQRTQKVKEQFKKLAEVGPERVEPSHIQGEIDRYSDIYSRPTVVSCLGVTEVQSSVCSRGESSDDISSLIKYLVADKANLSIVEDFVREYTDQAVGDWKIFANAENEFWTRFLDSLLAGTDQGGVITLMTSVLADTFEGGLAWFHGTSDTALLELSKRGYMTQLAQKLLKTEPEQGGNDQKNAKQFPLLYAMIQSECWKQLHLQSPPIPEPKKTKLSSKLWNRWKRSPSTPSKATRADRLPRPPTFSQGIMLTPPVLASNPTYVVLEPLKLVMYYLVCRGRIRGRIRVGISDRISDLQSGAKYAHSEYGLVVPEDPGSLFGTVVTERFFHNIKQASEALYNAKEKLTLSGIHEKVQEVFKIPLHPAHYWQIFTEATSKPPKVNGTPPNEDRDTIFKHRRNYAMFLVLTEAIPEDGYISLIGGHEPNVANFSSKLNDHSLIGFADSVLDSLNSELQDEYKGTALSLVQVISKNYISTLLTHRNRSF